MAREIEDKVTPSRSTSNNNKNDVKVNNNFSLTINFGDSLNVLALIAGVYLIRRMAKNRKLKKKAEKK
ncbi:hypothetical protein [Neobacillus sp. PS2-9]|jgi:hypothetical protein|uniref:hypothetical protein n=1 Tax=Neobacillus sp. PS2-9 TaxID=3070676 RepID=UPI0027DEFDE1|nr:hypothetical protein [Neobacillus sp. PS2-9]WML56214.1 hypothetical protein RCG25_14860 [Neobacillus sp. PS2-9]